MHGLKPRDSIPARIAKALLEEDGVLETVLALVCRALRLLATLARKWPWGHTVTAVAAYSAASRSRGRESASSPAPIAGLLEYIPTFARNFTVIAIAPEWL